MHWVDEYNWIPMKYENFMNKPVLCCGTILGTAAGVLQFLEFYVEAQTKQIGNEQGIWNIYIYNYAKSYALPALGCDSRILTLDNITFSHIPMNKEGKAVNIFGDLYAIVHMYNRCNPDFWKKKV
jgi:hypothetical protein